MTTACLYRFLGFHGKKNVGKLFILYMFRLCLTDERLHYSALFLCYAQKSNNKKKWPKALWTCSIKKEKKSTIELALFSSRFYVTPTISKIHYLNITTSMGFSLYIKEEEEKNTIQLDYPNKE